MAKHPHICFDRVLPRDFMRPQLTGVKSFGCENRIAHSRGMHKLIKLTRCRKRR